MGISSLDHELLLLTDYRNQFYESVRKRGASLDLAKIQLYFKVAGYELSVKNFRDIDFRNNNYMGHFILYQSSEDVNLYYKDYIEDVLLGLFLQGAILIPDFPMFRAHHNKVFMEIIRDLCLSSSNKNLVSKGFGTLEDFEQEIECLPADLVMKPSSGARSAGVRLLKGRAALLRHARRISSTMTFMEWGKNFVNEIIRKDYRKKSVNRRKFVVQEVIQGLTGDYKILAYGEKFYVLHRENRKDDFRASGSGRFSYTQELPEGLLDFAEKVFASFSVPFISLDVACSYGQFYLIEFQFISFGNYTLEKSSYYFARKGREWACINEKPDLEQEFVRSVIRHLGMMNNRSSAVEAAAHEPETEGKNN